MVEVVVRVVDLALVAGDLRQAAHAVVGVIGHPLIAGGIEIAVEVLDDFTCPTQPYASDR